MQCINAKPGVSADGGGEGGGGGGFKSRVQEKGSMDSGRQYQVAGLSMLNLSLSLSLSPPPPPPPPLPPALYGTKGVDGSQLSLPAVLIVQRGLMIGCTSIDSSPRALGALTGPLEISNPDRAAYLGQTLTRTVTATAYACRNSARSAAPPAARPPRA